MGEGGSNGAAAKPVVLVTGASAGLGRAIAHRFADGGFRVVAVARGRERLESLERELAGKSEVRIFAGDVTERGVPAAAVKLAMESFGRLDCLVSNAGAGHFVPVGETDDDILDEVIDMTLKGSFRFCREAVRVMRPGSSIVMVSSVWGLVGSAGGGAYSAVKAGLIGLGRTLAADYGAAGIRTNVLTPGVIRTDMTESFWDLDFFRRMNHEMTPFDREGLPEDVAHAAYFLASPEGGYINGQTIAIDGGWSATKYLRPEALAAERVSPAAPAAAG